jgi:hypothetical protein
MFSASGLAFAWKVAPLQKQLLAMSERDRDLDWIAYKSASLRWELWGLFATVTPAIAMVLMIWKPVI